MLVDGLTCMEGQFGASRVALGDDRNILVSSIALAHQSKMPMMLLKDACMEKFVSNVHKRYI